MENTLELYKSIIADLGRVPEHRLAEVRGWLDHLLAQIETEANQAGQYETVDQQKFEQLLNEGFQKYEATLLLMREEKIRQYVAEDFQRFEETFKALA